MNCRGSGTGMASEDRVIGGVAHAAVGTTAAGTTGDGTIAGHRTGSSAGTGCA